ncbi:hypothetical protein BT96DRAFT_1014631 [Gymnopus androsaceus JB14]|uniref:Uncharacterized protein n=1 Tax=Gymnopus androsaceus JB14 TaxID=1447944 RepID=A0A6A4I7H3_9AGAR|nr:hypothetical protein BT96DRAFT_1014631 [Gymnopus androsaceus JB14]
MKISIGLGRREKSTPAEYDPTKAPLLMPIHEYVTLTDTEPHGSSSSTPTTPLTSNPMAIILPAPAVWAILQLYLSPSTSEPPPPPRMPATPLTSLSSVFVFGDE